MNKMYLYRHIAEQLHTFLRVFADQAEKTAFTVYSGIADVYDHEIAAAAVRMLLEDHDGSNMCRLAQVSSAPNHPVLFSIEGRITYALAALTDCCALIGPLRFDSAVFFKHTVTLADLDLPETVLHKDLITQVPVCRLRDLAAQILLLCNIECEETNPAPSADVQTLLDENCVEHKVIQKTHQIMTDRLMANLDNQIAHNPYRQELRERRSIRDGDINRLRLAIEEDFSGEYGRLSDDPLRQEIDMGIVTITLATRAAIDGGLPPENAFYISDLTIRQMEAAKDPATVHHIFREAEYRLTGIVHELNESKRHSASLAGRSGRKDPLPARDDLSISGRAGEAYENSHISRAKDYIFSHLHERVTVQQVADAIALDRTYLSKLFSATQHITISQYIMNEKIRLARNLLTYSDYPYSRIAAYLGFSSQSHLGAEFKKKTGQTMGAYRDANKTW